MDSTPKARSKFHAKVKQSEIGKSPHRRTHEGSASKKTPEASTSEFSPVNSPSRYDRLSQDIQVRWEWKSPDEFPIKKNGVGWKTGRRNEATPTRVYSSPKPKRKLNNRNYSDKLRSLADELKSLTEGLTTSKLPEKPSSGGGKVNDRDSGAVLEEDSSGDSEKMGEVAVCGAEEPVQEPKMMETANESLLDVVIVELSPGDVTSLKSFPPGHQFPKVPKFDLESAINTCDYTVLMEDNSIEEEMMRFTQKIEEEFVARNKVEGNMASTPNRNGGAVISAVNKKVSSVKSPKTPSRGSKSPCSPALGRRSLSLKKNSPSPAKRSGKLRGNMLCNNGCNLPGVKKLGSSIEDDVSGMLADDSLDNIMLEMVVQSEPQKKVVSDHQDKENSHGGLTIGGKSDFSLKTDGDTKDSLVMLEDDSLSKPDVLNLLDTVESQAIAASQPLKCTPEEIKMKMVEAKKKLALARRKRRMQMKSNDVQPEVKVRSKSKC